MVEQCSNRRAHGDARECVDMIDSGAACVHATTDHFRIPNVGEVTIFRRISDCTRILLILLNNNSKLNYITLNALTPLNPRGL